MATRRAFVTAALGAAAGWACPVLAQPRERVRTVGFLVLTDTPEPLLARREHPLLGAFVEAMRGYGWVEGRNIRYEVRGNGMDDARRPAILDELLGKPLDAIVAPAHTAADVLARTRTLPVVSMGFDPSLVASLARPGGNLTGVIRNADDREVREVRAKLYSLLKEISGARHVALLAQADLDGPLPGIAVGPVNSEPAARLGMTIEVLPARDPAQLDHAFAEARRRGMDSLVLDNGLGWRPELAERLTRLVRRHRIPVVAEPQVTRAFEEAVIASYGLDFRALPSRLAYLTDRILRGARPGDLPVERPQDNRLIVNARNARAIGLTIPGSVLLQAAQVIN